MWKGFVESDVMASELEARGVARDRILRERCSSTTLENLDEARTIVAQRAGMATVAVVTCDWHLPRALAIACCLGLRAVGIEAPSGPAPVRLQVYRAIHEAVIRPIDVRLAVRRR